PSPMPAMKMEQMEDQKITPQGNTPPPGASPQPIIAPDPGPKVGEAAPELNIDRLDGRSIQLSSMKGKPLVIEFGSYSSPSFRQRAQHMEELARQYNNRANFLLIYTKEAHPTGGWEVDRNRDDHVLIAAHADLNAR